MSELDKMRRYVEQRLIESGVIHYEDANPENPESIAARIVSNAWRQTLHSLEAAYRYADVLIRAALIDPPDPITPKRFSLRAWLKQK